MAKVRIYLDTCCLCRLHDKPLDDRIRMEAIAVETILRQVTERKIIWICSDVVSLENLKNPSEEIRDAVAVSIALAQEYVATDPTIQRRAVSIMRLGIGYFDALHLATAERARCDVLLTVDDRFGKRSMREAGRINVVVENPLIWLARRLNT